MATLGGLVHVFNILETERLKKYTVYKIQMISFPKNENLFQSLTKLTITKRYSDFKTLENNILSTYKGYNFKTFFKSDSNFFNRFDLEVIEQRKRTILEFLYYCAEHSILYRSQHFVKFFDSTTSRNDEEPFCETKKYHEESPEESINSLDDANETAEEVIETDQLNTQESSDIDYYLCGYLYDAALNFSHAVQNEANFRYKSAFELYKAGIDKLLTGAKNDNNEMRKRIAKAKASKYLEKAEKLYENYILEQEENEFLIEDSDSKSNQSIASLERPISHMSRYRVIHINRRIMKVQDRADKKIYIMKVIWKSNSQNVIFMPQNIPFMCSLLSYFHSENAIFLLLPFVSGGLLWDYIQNYSPTSSNKQNLEEIFLDIDTKAPESNLTVKCVTENEDCLDVAGQLDAVDDTMVFQESVDKYKTPVGSILEEAENSAIFTPSFDALNADIDVDDLMKCSQQLLKSVTKTLEKSVILSTDVEKRESATEEKSEITENHAQSSSLMSNLSDETDSKKSTDTATNSTEVNIPEIILKRWASELIVSVDSLHKNGVVLGDLNLDNILLGSNAHILLTYFYRNSRSIYQHLCELSQQALKCHYVAFEFPLTKSSDYYSVGVVLYEIFTKNRFYMYHPGGIPKYNEIQYSDSCQLSEQAKDLLDVLIFKKFDIDSPFECIKTHSFFEGIDFNQIETFGYE